MFPVRKVGALTSSPVITRYEGNPVLAAADVPYPAQLVFNAGVIKYQGKYVMVFRNDFGFEPGKFTGQTNNGLAFSDDGIHWEIEPEPVFSMKTEEIGRVYDPRLVVIEEQVYLCFAMDTRHGLRAGIAKTDDFRHYDIISLSSPDNRNNVLFPERFGGKFVRLERPFPEYGRQENEWYDIWISDSPDLKYWGNSELLLGVESVPFANAKIGPGAPPIRTSAGWLTLFHSTDVDKSRGKNGWEDVWQKRYCVGVMLLDLDNPYKIKGMYQQPLMAPEAEYEISGGFRNNAIFPCGMVLEDSGEVKIYYGAADIVTCLATAHVDDLVRLCLEGK